LKKKKGKIAYTQNKNKMKEFMKPLVNWLAENKLNNEKMSKSEYVSSLGDWLTEYAASIGL